MWGQMHEAESLTFPFLEHVPLREKSKMRRAWDYFQKLREEVAAKGMIVPQHVVCELFGVSRSRVGQWLDEGRLESVDVGGMRYVTERSIKEFAKVERKNGRPPKASKVEYQAVPAKDRVAAMIDAVGDLQKNFK